MLLPLLAIALISTSPASATDTAEIQAADAAMKDSPPKAAAARAAHRRGFTDAEIRACLLTITPLGTSTGATASATCPVDRWKPLLDAAYSAADAADTAEYERSVANILRHGSTEGYGKSRWGWAPARVLQAYPQAKWHDGMLELSDKIERFSVVIAFRFTNKHLTQVGIGVQRHQRLPMSNSEINEAIEKLITAKYGDPRGTTDDGATVWMTASGLTAISLSETPLDLHHSSLLVYASAELADYEEHLNERSAASKL